MRNHGSLTRRNLIERAAQAGAGLTLAGALPVPSARAQHEPQNRHRLAPLPHPGLPAPPFTEGDYWRFADWIAPYFNPLWAPDKRCYLSGNGGVGRIYHNSLLLTTHSVAALSGHRGPSRQDERARVLARRLCESPPWNEDREPVEPDPQFHSPGWVESLSTRAAAMDKSIDPKVAESLMYAWRARDVLGLPTETRDLIADRVSRCARGSFFRFPGVRLNQINWNCELYSHLATITGDTELLRNDYRAQVERFCEGIRYPITKGGAANLGPGYRFHYLPHRPATHPFNLDSAEYASETCHFILYYEQALRAGMAPLTKDQMDLLRAWVEHILPAYWTHGGYLNWDTGYGFKRWHAGRTWALAQQGLLAIAASPRFHNDSRIGPWAKHLLDRGLVLYERHSREARDGLGIAPAVLYDIDEAPLGPTMRELFAARMQANAARAVAQGLGRVASSEPPPLYSYDGDIGRLAITTPVYSTAVLAVNQRAAPYGGTELARLYDGDQRVVSNVAGRPWASFGVVIRDAAGKQVIVSQRPQGTPPEYPPIELLRSPRGRVRAPVLYPKRPYGGPFEQVVARGTRESSEVAIETRHTFNRDWIQTAWTIVRRRAGRLSADVLFPTWGRGARVEAVLSGGRRVTLAGPGVARRRVALRKVAYFYLAGEETGYVVVPVGRRQRAVAYVTRPRRQSGSPRPGPTLVIELADRARFGRLRLTVRMAPAASPAQASSAARSIRPKRASGAA